MPYFASFVIIVELLLCPTLRVIVIIVELLLCPTLRVIVIIVELLLYPTLRVIIVERLFYTSSWFMFLHASLLYVAYYPNLVIIVVPLLCPTLRAIVIIVELLLCPTLRVIFIIVELLVYPTLGVSVSHDARLFTSGGYLELEIVEIIFIVASKASICICFCFRFK